MPKILANCRRTPAIVEVAFCGLGGGWAAPQVRHYRIQMQTVRDIAVLLACIPLQA